MAPRGWLLLLLFVLCPAAARGAALSADGRALLALLETFPASATREAVFRSWSAADRTPCGWAGVTCAAGTGAVVDVALPAGLAGGALPPEIGGLTSLQALRLPGRNLSGAIQAELAGCASLLVLDLSANNLSGAIPRQLFRLPNLLELSLHDNQLSGSLPPEIGLLWRLRLFRAGGNAALSGPLPPEIGNLSSLAQLGLAATSLSGSLPPQLGLLSHLTSLKLFTTNLSGRIPPQLGNCTQLQELHLFMNQFTGPLPPELARLPHLTVLNVWQNDLAGSIPPELGMLSSLQTFDLSQNSLSGSIPAALGNLTAVTKLYLSANSLSGSIPPQLGNCSSLQDLQLDRNALSGSIPQELGQLSHLLQIFLWNNSLEGSIPSSMGNCAELESLDFSWNRLTGPIPVEIGNLQSLQKFLLLSNQLSGEIPSAIGRCRSLYRLRLDINNLNGSIPKELGGLRNLTFFDISSNQISGVIPPEIGNCAALQLFNAHENQLGGAIPSEISLLSSLQLLDLSDNQLTGPIPAQIGSLGQLTKLILKGNLLSGSIPTELGACRKLMLLDLSSNTLSGSIPSSFGRIKTLSISLNISYNNFTGTIPREFSGLFALGELDVSHNSLSGSLDVLGTMGSLMTINVSFNDFTGGLPDTPIFRSLPTSDYAGNQGLCVPFCFPNATTSTLYKRIFPRNKIILGFLFGSVGVMFAIGAFLLISMSRNSGVNLQEPDMAWPWQITPFQKFSFTIDDVLDRLVDTNIVGKGCSGVVYKAELPGGEVIAVKKVLSRSKIISERDFFSTEIETLGAIRHLNIVRLLGYCTNHEINLLMYDYMPNGSLGEVLHEKRRMLDWDTRYNIALGAAQGLAYLHHDCLPPIIHRDIKANNILLGARLEPYLADFGLAKVLDSAGGTQTLLAGSYGYIAPEYAYTLTITDKSDVYSYGVVLLEVLTGKRPVDASLGEGRHLTDWVHEMQHCHHDVVDILDPRLRGMPDPYIDEMLQALGIALDCVHPVPEERPTMRHVVSLLVGIRHDIEEYAKLDVLAAAGKPTRKGNSPNYEMESHPFSHLTSLSFSCTPCKST